MDDEIVMTVKPNGDPWLVVHGHNGAAAAVATLDACTEAGVYEALGRAVEAMRTRTLLGQALGAVPVGTAPNRGQAQPYQAPPQQAYTPPQNQGFQQPQGGYQQPPGGYPQGYQQQQPQIPQLPPGEPEVKDCPHGGKRWKAGISKAGRPYGAWMCPAPQNQGQCPPEYPRR